MIKIVLDTNVLVSALLIPQGTPAKILQQFREGQYQLVLSGTILEEYGRVLRRKKFGLSLIKIEELLSILANEALWVIPSEHFNTILEDPADNEFLDVAVEAKASVLVTGDQHLLTLKKFRGIPIKTPADFIKEKPS